MNRLTTFAAFAAISCGAAFAQAPTDSLTVAAATSLGDFVASNLTTLSEAGYKVDPVLFNEVLLKAIKRADTGMTPTEANEYIYSLLEKAPELAPADLDKEAEFLRQAAEKEGAEVLPSGVVFLTLEEGKGAIPNITDTVSVRYVGRLSDGSIFDATEDDPAIFDVSGLIPGFTEGLLKMRTGGFYRVYIPASQAYGERGVEGVIPANAALDFVVQIEEILK